MSKRKCDEREDSDDEVIFVGESEVSVTILIDNTEARDLRKKEKKERENLERASPEPVQGEFYPYSAVTRQVKKPSAQARNDPIHDEDSEDEVGGAFGGSPPDQGEEHSTHSPGAREGSLAGLVRQSAIFDDIPGEESGRVGESDDESADGEKPGEEAGGVGKSDDESADGEKPGEEAGRVEESDEESADGEKSDEESADGEKPGKESADGEKPGEEAGRVGKSDDESADDEKSDEESADGKKPGEEAGRVGKSDDESADDEKSGDESADGENPGKESGGVEKPKEDSGKGKPAGDGEESDEDSDESLMRDTSDTDLPELEEVPDSQEVGWSDISILQASRKKRKGSKNKVKAGFKAHVWGIGETVGNLNLNDSVVLDPATDDPHKLLKNSFIAKNGLGGSFKPSEKGIPQDIQDSALEFLQTKIVNEDLLKSIEEYFGENFKENLVKSPLFFWAFARLANGYPNFRFSVSCWIQNPGDLKLYCPDKEFVRCLPDDKKLTNDRYINIVMFKDKKKWMYSILNKKVLS